MHAASLKTSARLQRVYCLLRKGQEFTTLDIIQKARVCSVNSIVAELRVAGHEIKCQRRGDKWFYKMERAA